MVRSVLSSSHGHTLFYIFSVRGGDYCQDDSGFLTDDNKRCAALQQLVSAAIFVSNKSGIWMDEQTASHEGICR